MDQSKSVAAPVRPILIAPGNALAATGLSWRWCRDFAAAHGVRFVGAGRKRALVASEFLAALEQSAQICADRTEGDAAPIADPAAAIRASLGKRRRAA
jgi:hypothetical protein